MLSNLYWSPVMLACYEGEGGDGAGGEGSGENTGKEVVKDASNDTPKETAKTFTQEQVNKFVAEDRRKTDAKYKAVLAEKEQLYNDLLANQNLTEQQRTAYEEKLSEVQKQLHSEKDMLLKEKKKVEDQLTAKLTEMEKNAQDWESRYKESNINRALQGAAATNDAYNSRQVVTLLRPKTKMVPVTDGDGKETGEYQIMVELDVTTDGKTTMEQLTPEAAMKRMKELPEQYGNLFKSSVVSGVGSNSATGGLSSGTAGTIDFKNMTQAQYREWRKTQPALAGSRGVRR